MRINGRIVKDSNEEFVVIPRPTGDLVFRAVAVRDFKPFNDLVPEPKPKMAMVPGGQMVPDPDDKDYLLRRQDYRDKQFDYLIVQSLAGTEGLEWDSVEATNPDTWKNWRTDLLAAGFVPREVNLIEAGALSANSLNEEKLEAARQRFLSFRAAQASAG